MILLLLLIAQVLCQESLRSYDFVSDPTLSRPTKHIVHFSFRAYNHTYALVLQPNRDFINAQVHIHGAEGVRTEELNSDHVYSGTLAVDGKKLKDSWARIVISEYKSL